MELSRDDLMKQIDELKNKNLILCRQLFGSPPAATGSTPCRARRKVPLSWRRFRQVSFDFNQINSRYVV